MPSGPDTSPSVDALTPASPGLRSQACAAVSTSTSAEGLPMSLQYRRLGRRIACGTARLVAAAVSLLAAPVTAGLNRLGGEGDILHAVARPGGDR